MVTSGRSKASAFQICFAHSFLILSASIRAFRSLLLAGSWLFRASVVISVRYSPSLAVQNRARSKSYVMIEQRRNGLLLEHQNWVEKSRRPPSQKRSLMKKSETCKRDCAPQSNGCFDPAVVEQPITMGATQAWQQILQGELDKKI